MALPDPKLIKLKLAGEAVTMTVDSATRMTIGKWPETQFLGSDGTARLEVRVPEDAAVRQLGRFKLVDQILVKLPGHDELTPVPDFRRVVGKIVTFSRDKSGEPTRPYWGVTVVGESKPVVNEAKAAVAAGYTPAEGPPEHDAPPPDDASAPPYVAPAFQRLDGLFRLHRMCVDHAAMIAQKLNREVGVPITLEGISALTAQPFIEFNRSQR